MSYDVIVVGARCAGAVLGTLLARSGVKTLMLDADTLPSDMAMSTHYIHPPGMDVLDELGVGERVRKVTPPTRRGRWDIDSITLSLQFPVGRTAYCVRRSTVDPMLQEAATTAGAELRDRHRVVDLVTDGERVAGVVVETPGGRETLRAKLVVGADGRSSTVARLTGVEEYLTFPMTRSAYWFYFREPPLWRKDPRFADWDVLLEWKGDGLRYVFQCDGDLLLTLVMPPSAEARGWGKDYKARTLEYLARSETIRPLVEASETVGKGMGLVKADFYYRRPVGPGFALVGDAGSFKDFVTGHGMTDAFLGAKRLHQAILADKPAAFERYWLERDAETMPLYFDAIQTGEVGFNNAFSRLFFEHLSRHPELAARLPAVFDRKLSPLEAFSPGELAKVLLGALIRGRFDVVRPFLASGKRVGGWSAEVARRKKALKAAAETPGA
jgi:2-polyprenyl-6-methoxyphenol hydroxylase-like FAD-dependent oxidoreductase